MNLIQELNEIHAMLAKSSMTELEYDSVSLKLLKIKKQYTIDPVNLSPEEVCNTIRNYYNLPKDFHINKSRRRDFVLGRQIAAKILVDNTKMTLTAIAKYFKKKTHGNIIHAKRTIEEQIENDRRVLRDYSNIIAIINRK